jgi:hypothetical protein
VTVKIAMNVDLFVPEAGDPVYGLRDEDPKNMAEAINHELRHLDDYVSLLKKLSAKGAKMEMATFKSGEDAKMAQAELNRYYEALEKHVHRAAKWWDAFIPKSWQGWFRWNPLF